MNHRSTAIAVLAGALLAVACQPDKPASTKTPATTAPPEAPAAATPPTGPLTSADAARNTDHDTLRVAGGVVRARPSTAAAFEQWRGTDPLPPEPNDTLDSPLDQTQGRVHRQGLDLLIQPEKGPALKLHNHMQEADFDLEHASDRAGRYRYWGALPTARQWVLSVAYYETSGVDLIDQRTGRRTDLWGRPVVSPDGRYLLSTSSGLGGGDQINGLQLFQLEATGPRKLWERDLTHWAPERARWAGPHTVLVEQRRLPAEGVQDDPPLTYLELDLPALK